MLILKRRYEFWISIVALHKINAVVIPATHLLTKKDIVYRANAAEIKAIVAVGDELILQHVASSLEDNADTNALKDACTVLSAAANLSLIVPIVP